MKMSSQQPGGHKSGKSSSKDKKGSGPNDKKVAISFFVLDGVLLVGAVILFATKPSCDTEKAGNIFGDSSSDIPGMESAELQFQGHHSPQFDQFQPSASFHASYNNYGSHGTSNTPSYGSYISSVGTPTTYYPNSVSGIHATSYGSYGTGTSSSYGSYPATPYDANYVSSPSYGSYSPSSSYGTVSYGSNYPSTSYGSSSGLSSYSPSTSYGSSYGSGYYPSNSYGSTSGSNSYSTSSGYLSYSPSTYGTSPGFGSYSPSISYGTNYGSYSRPGSFGSGSSYSSYFPATGYDSNYGSYSPSSSYGGSAYGSYSPSYPQGSNYGSFGSVTNYGITTGTSQISSVQGNYYGTGSHGSPSNAYGTASVGSPYPYGPAGAAVPPFGSTHGGTTSALGSSPGQYKNPNATSDLTLIPEDKYSNKNFECGVQSIKPNLQAGRVVGGTVAVPHSWPWWVHIGSVYENNKISTVCGGTIVSPRHVLSAYHCLTKGRPAHRYRVFIGKHDVEHVKGEPIPVKKLRIHPMGEDKLDLLYDLLLITLGRELQFSDKVQPVCLPKPQVEVVGKRCWAYGMGFTQDGVGWKYVKQVDLKVLSEAECISHHKRDKDSLKKEYVVCAGNEKGKDTCQGDSGGPLTCQENGKWVIYGATSWGHGCATGKPGMYAAVSFSMSWICCTLKDLPSCQGVACDIDNFLPGPQPSSPFF